VSLAAANDDVNDVGSVGRLAGCVRVRPGRAIERGAAETGAGAGVPAGFDLQPARAMRIGKALRIPAQTRRLGGGCAGE
jgi:hypothetical protein